MEVVNYNLEKMKEIIQKRNIYISQTNEDNFILNHEIKICDNELTIRNLLNKIYENQEFDNNDLIMLGNYLKGYEFYEKSKEENGIAEMTYRISSEELIGRVNNYSKVEHELIRTKIIELEIKDEQKHK